MQQATKRFRLTFGLLSIGYILLGFLQLFAPTSSQKVICTILGVVAVGVGILRIALFLMKQDAARAYQNDLAVGVVLLMGGVYLIVNGTTIWSWLPVIVGFAITFDSIVKLQYAFELRRTDFHYWWIAAVAALVSAVLATLLVLDRFTGEFRQVYWAIVMIVDGVFNLATIILLSMRLRKMAKPPKKEKRKKDNKALEAGATADTGDAFVDELEDTQEAFGMDGEFTLDE